MSHESGQTGCPVGGGERVNGPTCVHIETPPTTTACSDIVGYTCTPEGGYVPVAEGPTQVLSETLEVSAVQAGPTRLAFTGVDSAPMAAVGFFLVACGVVLRRAVRTA